MNAATWIVPEDHPAFAGHFPGRPIVPGVVLLDRALALIAAATQLDPSACTIASAKFLSPAGPGETLQFSWQRKDSGAIQFDITAACRSIATGLIAPPSPPAPPAR